MSLKKNPPESLEGVNASRRSYSILGIAISHGKHWNIVPVHIRRLGRKDLTVGFHGVAVTEVNPGTGELVA